MEHVDLGRREIEAPGGLDRHRARPGGAGGARSGRRDELGGDHSLQVLIEFLEKSEPPAVRLHAKTVELVAESREPLRQPALDLRFEQLRPVGCLRIGHFRHYRG